MEYGLWWPLWCLWGLIIGSFLNVCIWRMPRELSCVRPRSRCPACERPIAWYDNVPVLSFLLLRGACRHCGARISLRYPLVELLTGASAVAVFARFGPTPVALVYFAFVCGLIVSSFIDLDFQIIPDEISLGGLILGLAVSPLVPALHGTDDRMLALTRSLIGVLTGGGILYATGLIGDLLFRKESMGGGDIKLLAMAGSILGWKATVLTFFLAPFLALLPGLYVIVFKRSHVIPYGPFLSAALLFSLFAGDEILRITGIEGTLTLFWDYYRWR
ncbi:MAG TPA: prepilin peptidase [bacterium]